MSDRAGSLPPDLTGPGLEPLAELLVVMAGGRPHALHLAQVVEVVRLPAIARLPRVPTYLKGCALVRSEVLPVIELAGRLGLVAGAEDSPSGPRARLVVVRGAQGRGGLLVARVLGVWRDQVVREGRVIVEHGEEIALLDVEAVIDWRAG